MNQRLRGHNDEAVCISGYDPVARMQLSSGSASHGNDETSFFGVALTLVIFQLKFH